MTYISKVTMAACAAVLAFTSAAHAQQKPEAATTGNCGALKTHVVASNKDGTHPNATYSTIPEATVNFTTAAAGCVIVQYNALAFADTGTALFVRARLDGAAGTPPEIQFASDTPGGSFSHSTSFTFVNVPAGTHKIIMQHMKIGAGDAATNEHTTIVHHR